MDRIIKFRAWSPDNEEMYYADETYSFTVHDTSVGYRPHYETDELTSFSTDPDSWEKKIEVMQYTGLRDKNGTKVWEGDIIEFDGIAVVKHGDNGFHIESPGSKAVDYVTHLFGTSTVIGNIHEHPHLVL